MSTEIGTPIPAEDCSALVDWQDKFGTSVPHAKTDTTWSAEDDTGATSAAVTVNPDLDSDSDDETATVVFLDSKGLFKVVAVTAGASAPIRAESILYDVQPGAPAVGTITLNPV